MPRLLVTAGSTAVHWDRVRVLTNIFKGKTGVAIAAEARKRGWDVTILSNEGGVRYRTFDELAGLLEEHVRLGSYDAIIHSAAVSDQRIVGTYVLDGGNLLPLELKGSAAAKVPSGDREMFLKMAPTPKLIDRIRPWGFRGCLVKFKLQVDMEDQELLEIADKSRRHSGADLMVANCLEWSRDYAYILDEVTYRKVARQELAAALLQEVEWRTSC